LVVARAGLRAACCIVVALTVALVCQATAGADPWPSWNNTNPDGFTVSFAYTPELNGQYDVYTYTVRVRTTAWDQFHDFVVYPVNLNGYQPPETPGTKKSYGQAFDAQGEWLPNDAGWYGGTDLNRYLDGGFEVGPGKVPGYDGGAFGWWSGPNVGSGWQNAANRTIMFRARLPRVARGWEQKRFSMHVRPSWDLNNTNWRANGSSQIPPPVPEPSGLLLLAIGALGVLPLLRRRRTT